MTRSQLVCSQHSYTKWSWNRGTLRLKGQPLTGSGEQETVPNKLGAEDWHLKLSSDFHICVVVLGSTPTYRHILFIHTKTEKLTCVSSEGVGEGRKVVLFH